MQNKRKIRQTNSSPRVLGLRSRGLLFSFLGIIFILSAFVLISAELTPRDSSAVGSATATINVNIPDNISIELSKDELSIDLSSSEAAFGNDSTTVDVSTNNYTGYKLYLTDNDDTPVGNTALIRQKTDPSDTTEASIPTITMDSAHATTGYTSDEMQPITWGWSVTSATTGYKNISPKGASTAPLKNVDSATSEDLTPVFFGVKIYPTLPSGQYKSSVIFTAVANYVPTQNNEITNITPTTFYTTRTTPITIDTNIDYADNLVDGTHPLTVTLINAADNTDTITCGSVAVANNNNKLRITCTVPAAGTIDANYTVRLTFSKLGNLSYDSNDIISGAGFFDITNMQDMTAAICNSVYTPSSATGSNVTIISNKATYKSTVTGNNQPYVAQRTLSDVRDGKTYTVRKLADGNCWMTTNLALGGSSEMTLTSADSNVSSNFTLPVAETSAGAIWGNNDKHVFKTANQSGNGYYYNWYTVTAGSTKTSGSAEYSICPKSWRLPVVSEIQQLVGKYGLPTYGVQSGGNSYVTQATYSPMSWLLSGAYINGGLSYQNNDGGFYWNASVINADQANEFDLNLNYNGGHYRPEGANTKSFGFTTRCLAR